MVRFWSDDLELTNYVQS